MLETAQRRARERAQMAAQSTAGSAKEEVGRMAFDTLEEYFPEEAKARRNERRMTMLVAGMAIGALLVYLLRR